MVLPAVRLSFAHVDLQQRCCSPTSGAEPEGAAIEEQWLVRKNSLGISIHLPWLGYARWRQWREGSFGSTKRLGSEST